MFPLIERLPGNMHLGYMDAYHWDNFSDDFHIVKYPNFIMIRNGSLSYPYEKDPRKM